MLHNLFFARHSHTFGRIGSLAVLAMSISWPIAARASSLTATVTDACTYPRPGNNGKVVGHDVGFSAKINNTTYFFFGDTIIDHNGNGVLDWNCNTAPFQACVQDSDCSSGGKCGISDEFRKNTFVAKTTDTDATQCLNLQYKVDAQGKATALLTNALNECFIWPSGAIAANNQLYVLYQSYGEGDCNPSTTYIGGGFAKMTDLVNMTATRLPGYFFASNEPAMTAPLKTTVATCGTAVSYINLFGLQNGQDVYLVRVQQEDIEDPNAYLYWGSSNGKPGWVTTIFEATPIFSDAANTVRSDFSVAYNAYMGRYLAIYTCGPGAPFATAYQICATWALTAGNGENALTGGWAPGHKIYDCPGTQFESCYQGFQHSEFAQSSGQRLFVTGAKHVDADYDVRGRSFFLHWTP